MDVLLALPSISTTIKLTAASLTLWGIYAGLGVILKPYFSSLYNIPGPVPEHFLLGNLQKFFDAKDAGLYEEELMREYGHVIKIKALFNVCYASRKHFHAVAN